MNEREYRFIHSYAKVIRKKKRKDFKKLLVDFSQDIEYESNIATKLTLKDILVCLTQYPINLVRKRISKLLAEVEPKRFNDKKRKEIIYSLTKEERDFQRDFLVHHLIVESNYEYVQTQKIIQKDGKKFEPNLIKALIDPLEAVQHNALEMLRKIRPEKYPDNYYEALEQLPKGQKEKLYIILKERLRYDIDIKKYWTKRESFIRSAGSMNYPPANKLLIKFLDDPDPNCRWTLASTLSKIKNTNSIESLIVLLMDQDDNIRMTATSSLRKIMPQLYGNRSSQDILYDFAREDPIRLYKLMPKGNINIQARRIWSRLGYESSIIEFYRKKELPEIVEKYISEEQSNNDQQITNTIYFILKANVPRTIEYLDQLFVKEKIPEKRIIVQKLIRRIEEDFKVENDKGYSIFL